MKAKLQSQPAALCERLVLQDHIPLATPLVVYVEPSGYCNLRCTFCPQGVDGNKLKKSVMSFKLFKKLIDDLSAFPDTIRLLRICGNGEPLINKNIVKMLQYAQDKKVAKRTELVTNGILLIADLIENLPRLLDRIIISIEGLCAEDYQRVCGARINFRNLLDSLNNLYSRKGECVIHIKIFDDAVPRRSRKTTFLNMFGDRCDEIYIEKIVPLWPQLDIAWSCNDFRWGGRELLKRRVCAQMFKGLQVWADGEVAPCCVDWRRVNVLGNIGKDSLYEIWNGEKLRKLQVEHLMGNKSKTEPCKDCTMNDYSEIDNVDAHAKKCMQRLFKYSRKKIPLNR